MKKKIVIILFSRKGKQEGMDGGNFIILNINSIYLLIKNKSILNEISK